MALNTVMNIIDHLAVQLTSITNANGYVNTVQYVDKEYRERSIDNYPFLFINDITEQYIRRICKDLYKKSVLIDIVGFVYDDAPGIDNPNLGTMLRTFKDDVLTCLRDDVFFNSTDVKLNIIEVVTEDNYVPPNASFLCRIAVTCYNDR